MGLDTVELVLTYEDEFGILIPDADAERMRTVGDVSSFIASKVDPALWPKERVEVRVREITANQLGLKLDQVQLSHRFVEDLDCG